MCVLAGRAVDSGLAARRLLFEEHEPVRSQPFEDTTSSHLERQGSLAGRPRKRFAAPVGLANLRDRQPLAFLDACCGRGDGQACGAIPALYFLLLTPMQSLRMLFRAVIGLPTRTTLDGRPLPSSLASYTPVAIAHDRRLSAGIFELRRRKAAPLYRIVAWRTYADKQGHEQATMSLHRDEIDPALSCWSSAAGGWARACSSLGGMACPWAHRLRPADDLSASSAGGPPAAWESFVPRLPDVIRSEWRQRIGWDGRRIGPVMLQGELAEIAIVPTKGTGNRPFHAVARTWLWWGGIDRSRRRCRGVLRSGLPVVRSRGLKRSKKSLCRRSGCARLTYGIIVLCDPGVLTGCHGIVGTPP